ncbi:hypothetical protein PHYPSEUDO_009555 [Phytophthora pseudosyringae]|uniref:Uncharacterized protein n=1 Tax=Phytophthora pseudosyringae TaxID=221518 RepID=A0A8T1WJH6_9STRA|nr:hypothetical protein PHYPSEUDO_009555 [Phytophthora pseudosyringae]
MQQDYTVVKGEMPPERESSTCLYPSKPCDNPRAKKYNGQLHKFCQFHRDKANFHQRHLEFKRMSTQENNPSAVGGNIPMQPPGPPLLPRQPTSVAKAGEDEEDFELDEEDIRLIEEVASASIES